MKAKAKVGDFVFYNHHQLSLIVDQKVFLEIGYKIWNDATNKYEGFKMYPRIDRNRDYTIQINREKTLWQKAKAQPEMLRATIKAAFHAKVIQPS